MIDRKIRIFILGFVLWVLPLLHAQAQDSLSLPYKPPIASVYIGNPVGMINNIRFKGEVRISATKTLAATYARYYLMVPGEQMYLELRKYNKVKQKGKDFFYTKAGKGNSNGGGNYVLVGYGIGQQFHLKSDPRFVLQITQGLKACIPIDGKELDTAPNGFKGLFYLTGPGAIFDFTIFLGYRF